MKKIVSAVAIAALAFSAFSADVTFKLASRVQADVVKSVTKTNDTDKSKDYTTTQFFGLSKGSADKGGFAEAKDDFQATIKTEYADATAKLVLNNDKDTVALDTTFYGALHFGTLNFTFGKFDSRWSKRYNTKTTSEIGLTDSTAGKFGIKSVDWANDVNDVSGYNAKRSNVALVVDYTFKDVGGGDLLLKAAAQQLEEGFFNTAKDNDGSKKELYIQPAFSIGYRLPDAIAVEAVARLHTATKSAFGLIVQPLMLPGTTLVGFTFAMNRGNDITVTENTNTITDLKGNAFAIDVGTVQTKLVENLTLVAQVKYEMILPGVDNVIATSTSPKKTENVSALYGYLGIGYKINDLVKVALDASLEMTDLTDYDSTDAASNNFTIQPAVQFFAGSGASINAGFRYKKALDGDDKKLTTQTIEVPLVLRVNL